MDTEVSYHGYLRIGELLSLQQPLSENHDTEHTVLSEHFFIICHQTCELWLKQILADLSAVEEAFSTMRPAELERAVDLLYRVGDLLRMLHEQLVALERLPLEDFADFRRHLGSASGAQSSQFRELDRIIGNASRSGTLYPAFARGVERTGGTMAKIVEAGVAAGTEHRIVEALLHLGNGYLRWKVGHVGLTSRVLGETAGTGGSSGVAHLLDRATLPFTELRLLRGEVHRRVATAEGAASDGRDSRTD
ncbi:tryptophan 2,3-dioxygenase family protein [Actinopolyspora sp. H202]|uniref:tryptophan 2,3-dioxygenase family protein n=1 Tax=Actinopolyspora sp. H202 TaxID=1500456 RepID=UPI003EE519D6